MQDSFQFQMPTRIFFGRAVIDKIGDNALKYGRRALVVAGEMAKNSGALQAVTEALKSANIECVIFDRVGAQPKIQEIEQGAQVGKAEHCEIVVGIGGECPMDAAKVMAALIPADAHLADFFGADQIELQPLPIVSIPLTAGSGSEVTPLAAITVDNVSPEIKVVTSTKIYPNLVFVDPAFTIAFPEAVTVANGLDALSHSVEGITSGNSQPLTDILAVESIKLITRYLPEVIHDPQNLAYRTKMSYASLLAGIVAGQTGLGLAHYMGFYLTLDLGLKHGIANGLLLPRSCKMILDRDSAKLDTLAAAFGADIGRPPKADAIEAVTEHIQAFTSQFNISAALNAKNGLEERIRNYAERLMNNIEPSLMGALNLRESEIVDIYRKSLIS